MQQLPPVKSTSDASENDEEQQHVSSSTTTPLKTTTPFLSDQDHNHHVVNNDDEDDEITTRTTRTTITSSGHPSVSTHPMNVSPSSFSSQPEQQQFFQIPKLALSNLHPSNPMNDASQVTHTTQPPPQPFNNYMNNYSSVPSHHNNHQSIPNTYSPNSSRSHHSNHSNYSNPLLFMNNSTNQGYPPFNNNYHYNSSSMMNGGVMYSTPSPMSTSRRHRYMMTSSMMMMMNNHPMTSSTTPSSQRFSMTSPMSHRNYPSHLLNHSSSTPSLWKNVDTSGMVPIMSSTTTPYLHHYNWNGGGQQPVNMYAVPPSQQPSQQFNSFHTMSQPTTPEMVDSQLSSCSGMIMSSSTNARMSSLEEEHSAVDALCERQFDRLFQGVGALLDESEREVEQLRMWNEKTCEEIDFLNQVRENLVFQCEELTRELEKEKSNVLSKTKEIETIKFDLELKNLENRNFERQIFTLKQQIAESSDVINRLETNLSNKEKQLVKLDEDMRKEVETVTQRLTEEIKRKEKMLADVEEEHKLKTAEIISLNRKLENCNIELADFKSLKDRMEKQIDQLKLENKTLKNNNEGYLNIIEQQNKTINRINCSIKEKENDIDQKENE
nr:unnamed protein product [Naegleria fowleri]